MDFDDLDDAEGALGPSPDELRAELKAKQVPEEMPGAREHPAPGSRNLGPKATMKMLYLHGPGSSEKMARMQITNMFNKIPIVADMKVLDFDVVEGNISQALEEIHADPTVQDAFRPYGPNFLSYLRVEPYCMQLEAWQELDGATERVASHLKEHGPYDGIVGFDMGGNVAFNCARLAQEEHEAFQGMFRFLILFSTTGPKALGYDPAVARKMNDIRPKAPLQISTLLAFSRYEDDARQFCSYEELALYIHPNYRTLVYHDQGHRPPNIARDTPPCDVAEKFLSGMTAGTTFKLTEIGDGEPYKEFWLPLYREPLPEVPDDAVTKLIVVTDPLGEHGPDPSEAKDFVKFPAQEMFTTREKRLALARAIRGTSFEEFEKAAGSTSLEVLNASYREEHRKAQWHPKENPASRWVLPEDVIEMGWKEGTYIAEELLEELSFGVGDTVCILGIGTGAYVALLLAEAIMRIRSVTPARIWAVCPPAILPFAGMPEMGWLVNSPIRVMRSPVDISGSPWQMESLTFGHFSHGLYNTKDEMIKSVVAEAGALNGSPEDLEVSEDSLKAAHAAIGESLLAAVQAAKEAMKA